MKWCNKGQHDVPADGFAKNQSVCRACYKLHYYPRSSCVDCGAVVSGRAKRCHACEGVNRRRAKHPRYSGGRTVNKDGYARLSGHHGHPNAQARGYILEHVYVMSTMLGRPLLPGENVHHKNGVREDNRPENLELWVVSQPAGQRPADLVAWALEILDRYGSQEAA